MIRGRLFASLAALSVALAGCEDVDIDAGPGPSPTPTPSPTATPSPSPAYPEFPLAEPEVFRTLTASTSVTGDLADGPATAGAAATEMRSDRVEVALTPNYSAGTFAIHEAWEEERFGAEDLEVEPARDVREFVFRETADGDRFSQLELLNNLIPGRVTDDEALRLEQVSYAHWWRSDGRTAQKRFTYAVWGYPTAPSDMPDGGTVEYATRVTGRLVSVDGNGTGGSVERLVGTATVSIDYATGLVDLALDLDRIDADGEERDYGEFTGQGAIAVGANQFSGSFGPGIGLTGTFSGGLFGPRAAEIGIGFALAGLREEGTADFNDRVVGAVVGRRE